MFSTITPDPPKKSKTYPSWTFLHPSLSNSLFIDLYYTQSNLQSNMHGPLDMCFQGFCMNSLMGFWWYSGYFVDTENLIDILPSHLVLGIITSTEEEASNLEDPSPWGPHLFNLQSWSFFQRFFWWVYQLALHLLAAILSRIFFNSYIYQSGLIQISVLCLNSVFETFWINEIEPKKVDSRRFKYL